MNGCRNKSSLFEWKGARGGDQASGLGMDTVWVRKDRERPFQNWWTCIIKRSPSHGAKRGGGNLLGVSMEGCMRRNKDLVAKRRRTACYISWER